MILADFVEMLFIVIITTLAYVTFSSIVGGALTYLFNLGKWWSDSEYILILRGQIVMVPVSIIIILAVNFPDYVLW